jgi:hypothetical protein
MFMDEWTHRPIEEALQDVALALSMSVPAVLEAFQEALAERNVA